MLSLVKPDASDTELLPAPLVPPQVTVKGAQKASATATAPTEKQPATFSTGIQQIIGQAAWALCRKQSLCLGCGFREPNLDTGIAQGSISLPLGPHGEGLSEKKKNT